MLQVCSYPHLGVGSELRDEADLIGEVPPTGMLFKCLKPALLSRDGLERQSELMRPRMEKVASSSCDVEVDKSVWQQTMEEVQQDG